MSMQKQQSHPMHGPCCFHPHHHLMPMPIKKACKIQNQPLAHHAPPALIPYAPCSPCRTNQTTPSQSLSRKPKLRSSRRVIKDDELRLEEDITKDGLSDAVIALETTEAASTLGRRRIVHVAARDDGCVSSDLESEVRKGGGAAEDVSTVCLAVGGSGDLSVVCGDEVVGEEEEGCSGVGDGGDAFADCGSRTDGVSA